MKGSKIYEGSNKNLYQAASEYTLIMGFTDGFRLKDGKVVEISGKGVINNLISCFIMQKLDMIGIDNHFIEKLNMREQLIQFVDVVPCQVFVSSIACGRYVTQFGMEEGYVFDKPLIDFSIKSRDLFYPPINENQLINFNWLTSEEMQFIKEKSMIVHSFLTGLFASVGIRLVEVKLEFGRVFDGETQILMICDEISLDNCRLWDSLSNQKLGWDAIEESKESAISTYQLILQRLNLSDM